MISRIFYLLLLHRNVDGQVLEKFVASCLLFCNNLLLVVQKLLFCLIEQILLVHELIFQALVMGNSLAV